MSAARLKAEGKPHELSERLSQLYTAMMEWLREPDFKGLER